MAAAAELQELVEAWDFVGCHCRVAHRDEQPLLATHGDAEPVCEEQVSEFPALGLFVGRLAPVRAGDRKEYDIELLSLEGVHGSDAEAFARFTLGVDRCAPRVGDDQRPIVRERSQAFALHGILDGFDLGGVEGDDADTQARGFFEKLPCFGGDPVRLAAPPPAISGPFLAAG